MPQMYMSMLLLMEMPIRSFLSSNSGGVEENSREVADGKGIP